MHDCKVCKLTTPDGEDVQRSREEKSCFNANLFSVKLFIILVVVKILDSGEKWQVMRLLTPPKESDRVSQTNHLAQLSAVCSHFPFVRRRTSLSAASSHYGNGSRLAFNREIKLGIVPPQIDYINIYISAPAKLFFSVFSSVFILSSSLRFCPFITFAMVDGQPDWPGSSERVRHSVSRKNRERSSGV